MSAYERRLPHVGKIRNIGHNNVPPCQFNQIPILGFGKFKGLQVHLVSMVSRAVFLFCFCEDHAGFILSLPFPWHALYAVDEKASRETARLVRPCSFSAFPATAGAIYLD